MAAYPSLWAKMISEWRQPGSEDRAWLMYSANYLFRTANIHWSIDSLRLKQRLPVAPDMPADVLKNLSFILLTHQHGDHLDLDLLRQLKDFPILWIIPAPVLDLVLAKFQLPMARVIVPQTMQPVEIKGICITPFDGLHWEKQDGNEPLRGVPATGYLVEFNDKRWLFPGDTRNTSPVNCLPLVR